MWLSLWQLYRANYLYIFTLPICNKASFYIVNTTASTWVYITHTHIQILHSFGLLTNNYMERCRKQRLKLSFWTFISILMSLDSNTILTQFFLHLCCKNKRNQKKNDTIKIAGIRLTNKNRYKCFHMEEYITGSGCSSHVSTIFAQFVSQIKIHFLLYQGKSNSPY